MLDFKPITLGDKKILSGYLASVPPYFIEHSFNTLFPWQQAHNFEWAVWEDWLFIKTKYLGITSFMPPMGEDPDLEKPLKLIMDYCKQQEIPCILTEVGDKDLPKIQHAMPDIFSVKTDRNNANYIYNISDLTNLSGKRYHQKKNHLNSFKRQYPDYEFLPLTEKMVIPCKETLRRWCEENNCTDFPTLRQERLAINVLLDNIGDLDYFGACIAINGRVEAFTIGEILNENTVAILIEKANSSINGLYTAINQMFLAEYWQDFDFVNRAEDLGLANLRKTKMSYYPSRLEMKYVLRPYSQLVLKPTSMGEGL